MIEIVEYPDEDEANFTAFRDRVFTAADERLERVSVPLVIDGDGKAVEHRSGVLLQIDNMRFLITAAHYLLDHHDNGRSLCIVRPVKGSHPVALVEERFWSTKDDDEDITVTKLSDEVADYIKDDFDCLRLTDLMSKNDRLQGDGLYLIYGFPDAMIGRDEDGVKIVGSWKYLTCIYRGDFANVERYRDDLHIVLDYKRDTYDDKGRKVHPPGMSGCGIWYAGNTISHALINKDDLKLVGIQNCWHRGHEYAKGTWIDDVLLIIWKYYPAARGVMRFYGMNFG